MDCSSEELVEIANLNEKIDILTRELEESRDRDIHDASPSRKVPYAFSHASIKILNT